MTKILVEHEIHCEGDLCGYCNSCILKLVNIKSGIYVQNCAFFNKELTEDKEYKSPPSGFKNYQRLPECYAAEVKDK